MGNQSSRATSLNHAGPDIKSCRPKGQTPVPRLQLNNIDQNEGNNQFQMTMGI